MNELKAMQEKLLMDKTQIISIITPSFNQVSYINFTLQSVVCQKGNFYIDYIIIDGGSIDGSVSVIKEFNDKITTAEIACTLEDVVFYKNDVHGLINCNGVSFRWISEKDKGHGDALNKGFYMSLGNIMAWINSDDIYQPHAFQTVKEVFDTFDFVEWIVGKNSWWNAQGEKIGERMVFKNIFNYLLDDYTWIQQESTFWKRSLWEKAGACINDSYKFMVDGELWSRYFQITELYHLDTVIGGYRMHETNRAKLNIEKIHSEMINVTSDLRKKLNLPEERTYKMISMETGIARINMVDFNYGDLENKLKQLESRILNSTSMKVGKFITWPFRKVNKLFQKII